jgi:oxygen-independent coproporphyrinogen-3 oxidase
MRTNQSTAPAALDPRVFPHGLYIHLPFCNAICTYCDFAVERYSAARATVYLEALARELEVRIRDLFERNSIHGERFAPRTIFLGGGTPTAFSAAELARFFEILERFVDTGSAVEFSIEANPGTLDAAKLELLREHRVNRLSIGVQSFQPHLLKLLGRVHGADQGPEAVVLARTAGFKNISIDLMHGLPQQSAEDLRLDLERAVALGVEHISAYCLMYEDGTPLKNAVSRGVIEPLTPELEAAHYLTVMETLDAAGWTQYEVSNFARPGFESEHNQLYWRNEAYLGVGVSAASYGDGERCVNDDDVGRYVRQASESGWAIASRERLDPAARAREALILELRMRRGVDREQFAARWGCDPLADGEAALSRYLSEGLLERLADGRYRITRRGLPVADGILAEFV